MSRDIINKAVNRYINGDKSAFEVIYDNTYKVVFFVAHNILHNKELADNIVQDTYLTLLKHLDNYIDKNFLAYATTIAKNLAINLYNHNKREVLTDFEVNYLDKTTLVKDEQSIGLIDLAEKLLSEQDFLIVIMYAVAGYNRREIAKILDLPISTVSYRYSNSILLLEKNIEKEDANEKS